MKVKLGQEMWVLDGELLIPWVKIQSGEGARGIAVPKPVVLERGQEVQVFDLKEVEIAGFGQERVDPRAGIPSLYGEGCQHDLPERVASDEFLAAMGHTQDECACWCKGCNSGKHCHDQRCYPLYD